MWSRSVGITLADSARLTTFMCHTLTYLLTPERSGVDKKTRNTFCRTRSLSNATFSFLITWRSSSSKSAAVYIRFFTEIWRYIDFQNGGRPPSWNYFTTIRDHPRSLCCQPQLPIKFHVNLIHRFEFFAYLAWTAYSGPQNGGFGGLWTHKCDYSSSRPQKKAHSCVNPRLLSYQL